MTMMITQYNWSHLPLLHWHIPQVNVPFPFVQSGLFCTALSSHSQPHIALTWVSKDPKPRIRKFILNELREIQITTDNEFNINYRLVPLVNSELHWRRVAVMLKTAVWLIWRPLQVLPSGLLEEMWKSLLLWQYCQKNSLWTCYRGDIKSNAGSIIRRNNNTLWYSL